ncbi:DNA-binding response OmpR family regulator [Catenuloplanes nepalensis]|uniref:DNA-binding response OmpR family regulator n=1 Tax=Catenuloplanes nepalensis TaxID=587533 RepID=A0ABT9MNR3_9ACTN|nr:response regulator transcription factor [Catenuloplanes nepalensis]MDP9793087.1 DNA-binding response OmpR family regulator [Catenuloplanes nepalensis]
MATILVVDDDPAIRQLLTDVLEMDDHVVAVAVDGHDGLRAFEVVRPDFVILDVMMPGLDGYGVLRDIRGQDGDPVPVLMLTAAADADSASRGWADGVDYYLAKPFAAADVLDLVEGALGQRIPVVGEGGPGSSGSK